jgi:subtilisin family serine protease
MRLPAVACAATLLLALPGSAGAADVVKGRLIVGFTAETSHQRVASLVQGAGARIERRLDRIGALLIRPRHGTATKGLRDRLRHARGVRYVEPDFIVAKSATPDDPDYNRQWALQPIGNGIAAPSAWDRRTACSLVATLDTGAQYTHPDLTGNIWHNPHEVDDNGKDDDHNGWVDDYYGVNVQQGSGNAVDGDGHGTHVAGIIAGHGNNATGIAGTCWTASVMPIRFMNSQGKGSTSDAVTGLDYAIHEHAKVVNCSFGSSSKSTALEDAVKSAESAGVLLVVAAGNDTQSIDAEPEYPASYTEGNILTVAAIDDTGALASFSNYGAKSVDLAAPGDEIFSTYPTSSYKLLSGTSMAAPMVAATAAMLHAQDPDLTYSQIRSTIKASVVPDAALAGKTVTGGLLNLDGALQQAG